MKRPSIAAIWVWGQKQKLCFQEGTEASKGLLPLCNLNQEWLMGGSQEIKEYKAQESCVMFF